MAHECDDSNWRVIGGGGGKSDREKRRHALRICDGHQQPTAQRDRCIGTIQQLNIYLNIPAIPNILFAREVKIQIPPLAFGP